MVNVDIPPERVVDPPEKNTPGLGLGRDPERTPMQWDASPQAGFTSGTPWLPLAPDYEHHNVKAQKDDPGSMLHLYRRLLSLRRVEPALAIGGYQPCSSHEDLFVYLRRHGGTAFLVLLNFSSEARVWEDHYGCGAGRVLISTLESDSDREVENAIELRPDEGLLIRLYEPPPEHPRSNIG